jgi:hypothetical protein
MRCSAAHRGTGRWPAVRIRTTASVRGSPGHCSIRAGRCTRAPRRGTCCARTRGSRSTPSTTTSSPRSRTAPAPPARSAPPWNVHATPSPTLSECWSPPAASAGNRTSSAPSTPSSRSPTPSSAATSSSPSLRLPPYSRASPSRCGGRPLRPGSVRPAGHALVALDAESAQSHRAERVNRGDGRGRHPPQERPRPSRGTGRAAARTPFSAATAFSVTPHRVTG